MKFAHAAFAALPSFSIAAFAAGCVFAGAWTLPEGKGQAVATSTYTKSTRAFDDDGDLVRTPTFSKFEASLLLEYGLTDWLTLMLQPQFVHYDIAPPTDAETTGPGFTEIGARARLWSNATDVFSAQVVGRIPGRHGESNPAEAGYTDPELDMRLLYGHSFMVRGMAAYIDAQAGYRVRFDDPTNELRLDLTFGIRPRERLLLLAQSFNTISDGSAAGIFEDGREHKVQLSAVWSLNEAWAVQVGGIATIAGEDALRERGVVAALWRKF